MRKFARIFLRGEFIYRGLIFPVCGKTLSKALVVLRRGWKKAPEGTGRYNFKTFKYDKF